MKAKINSGMFVRTKIADWGERIAAERESSLNALERTEKPWNRFATASEDLARAIAAGTCADFNARRSLECVAVLLDSIADPLADVPIQDEAGYESNRDLRKALHTDLRKAQRQAHLTELNATSVALDKKLTKHFDTELQKLGKASNRGSTLTPRGRGRPRNARRVGAKVLKDCIDTLPAESYTDALMWLRERCQQIEDGKSPAEAFEEEKGHPSNLLARDRRIAQLVHLRRYLAKVHLPEIGRLRHVHADLRKCRELIKNQSAFLKSHGVRDLSLVRSNSIYAKHKQWCESVLSIETLQRDARRFFDDHHVELLCSRRTML